ncbi:MAG: 2-aminoethylphosphonate--pyruvate transaminase [Gammaproteobacteria bacterium]|nr:2-aminoethylphosphonate--pyruvate transaminase [Gammaproteobacteria bacterium]
MNLSEHFDLVIFDWAGTMVDFGCRAPVEALIEAFARRGVALSESEARRDMGKAKADHVRALLADAHVAAAWRAANGTAASEADCLALIDDLGPLMRERAASSADLIAGAADTVKALRAAGIKVASSTGYTRQMMAPVLERAAAQGYAPDHLLCSGDTPAGRPSPLMIYRACAELGVWPLSRVVKVDDSAAGVAEGRAAGALSVGVAASGNGVGLSAAQWASLAPEERSRRREAAADELRAAGADLVIDTVADLVPALKRHLAGSRGAGETAPILLTPGPLTTESATKSAMLVDWGSWDGAFNALTANVCRRLNDIVGGGAEHACIPLQGSGTFAVEAALGTLLPRGARVLVPDNGSYCKRILRILGYLGREAVALPFDERSPADPRRIDAALAADPTITHVAQVHCETSTGILNPLEEIAAVTASRGRALIVDAMSSYGALPIDASRVRFDALVAASGKCLEGVPGMGFVIARRAALERSSGNAHSLALDLLDQWQYLQKTGQWRFTPPTHVVAALHAALDRYEAQGGRSARLGRYLDNCNALIEGMRAAGFSPLLAAEHQAPIIVTFHSPADPRYDFREFYRRVRDRGFILYPGKLTAVDTFRVGCIGAIGRAEIAGAVAAMRAALAEMDVREMAPR